MRLWIIGNGFDLYHGLKTSYYDYKEFLCKKNTCKRWDPIYQDITTKKDSINRGSMNMIPQKTLSPVGMAEF